MMIFQKVIRKRDGKFKFLKMLPQQEVFVCVFHEKLDCYTSDISIAVQALLPSEYWWFTFKRATEVSNYIPLRVDGKLTTPHELVCNKKPDLRHLLPLFAVSYPSYESPHSTDTQTTRAILVGKSNSTNSYEFYCPKTKINSLRPQSSIN